MSIDTDYSSYKTQNLANLKKQANDAWEKGNQKLYTDLSLRISEIEQIQGVGGTPSNNGTTATLSYLSPRVSFAAGTAWTSIPNIPTAAVRLSYEIEAVSTDAVVGRLSTDPTPDPDPANEWILTNFQTGIIDTAQEVANFKVRRSPSTTSLIVRVAFYG
jgi:hypothetical protein